MNRSVADVAGRVEWKSCGGSVEILWERLRRLVVEGYARDLLGLELDVEVIEAG
jgi:hypothetical protein